MVTFKENYHFPRFKRVSNIFQGGGGGGPLFSSGGGGVNCLLLIENHLTFDFPALTLILQRTKNFVSSFLIFKLDISCESSASRK